MLTLNPTPEIELPPTDLIYDDGEPLETNQHRLFMNVLIHSIEEAWKDRNDFFVGGNMFIYYSLEQVKNKDFRGPDFFVVLNTHYDFTRKAWVTWEEQGRYPDVIIELMSPSTAKIDKNEKKELYQNTFRTKEYYVFDPFNPNSLQGWRLNSNLIYEEITPNDQGWLWCNSLNFWLGTWEGTIIRFSTTWLRFYHENGDLVLLTEEAERQKANLAQQKADLAQKKADLAQQKNEILAARLRELGENPDDYLK
jgi:Uma2 family endonuclease